MKAPKPDFVWRIRPDTDHPSRFVRVLVFDTLKKMREWCVLQGGVTHTATGRRLTSKSRYRNGYGVCVVRDWEPQVATVVLCRDHCYPRVASHEFMHASMAYLNRYLCRGVDVFGRDLIFGKIGEQLAYFNGNLNAEFYRRCDKAGIK